MLGGGVGEHQGLKSLLYQAQGKRKTKTGRAVSQSGETSYGSKASLVNKKRTCTDRKESGGAKESRETSMVKHEKRGKKKGKSGTTKNLDPLAFWRGSPLVRLDL